MLTWAASLGSRPNKGKIKRHVDDKLDAMTLTTRGRLSYLGRESIMCASCDGALDLQVCKMGAPNNL